MKTQNLSFNLKKLMYSFYTLVLALSLTNCVEQTNKTNTNVNSAEDTSEVIESTIDLKGKKNWVLHTFIKRSILSSIVTKYSIKYRKKRNGIFICRWAR